MSQNNNDSSSDPLYIIGALMVGFLLIQFFFGEQVAWVYVQVRGLWLRVITSVWQAPSLMDALRLVQTRRVAELDKDQLSSLSSVLRWFMFPLWGGLVGWRMRKALKRNPNQSFRRKLSRSSLSSEMAKDFPWVLPTLPLNLASVPIDEGDWAMALTPLQFSRKFGLLNGKQVDRARATRCFALQLGKLWSGPERLNPHARALFACFAAQACRDTDAADSALRELAVSISAGTPVWTQSAALLKKYGNDPRVLEICKRHAYQSTVMIAMFVAGKSSGILPPNHFLWLRPINRPLWLSMDCVLRRTYFAEVSGIYAHYLAETVAGHAIERPMVGAASVALDISIKEIAFDAAPEAAQAPTS